MKTKSEGINMTDDRFKKFQIILEEIKITFSKPLEMLVNNKLLDIINSWNEMKRIFYFKTLTK
jgi:hypothetical protein